MEGHIMEKLIVPAIALQDSDVFKMAGSKYYVVKCADSHYTPDRLRILAVNLDNEGIEIAIYVHKSTFFKIDRP
jgi:hypothetical protein